MAVEFSGVAVLAHRGEPVVTQPYGRVDASMAFEIASGSKQFAACAALMLADRGALALDGSIAAYLPGARADITVHQLLCHTSRIGHWESIPGLEVSEASNADEVTALILAAPLGEPGWRYSSPGYVLLARIVEAVSGRPYADFVAAEIFEPLGMRDSTIATAPPNAARGHHEGEPTRAWNLAATPGAGDAWSTVTDLVRFVRAIHADRELLSASSHEAMVAAQAPIRDGWRTDDGWLLAESYGYGIATGRLGGERAWFHPGDNPGFQSFRAWFPDSDRTAVVLSDDDASDLEPVLRSLLADR